MSFARIARAWTPAQSLLVGFTLMVLMGALLLALPVASQGGTPTAFVDALFTSASAVTTTGLVVLDTGSHFSLFGEVVILVLFQVGGLGYMTFIAFLAFLARNRLSLAAGMTLEESLAGANVGALGAFLKSVILVTIGAEALGALALTAVFLGEVPLGQALYLGIFHSVSAFCTAGFSLRSDSFMGFADSLLMHGSMAPITLAGALGFLVLRNLAAHFRSPRHAGPPPRLSLHARLALGVTGAQVLLGSALLFWTEAAQPPGRRLLDASFQALSAATTTGFNTVDIGGMTTTGLTVLLGLMFIGASPGGTGGGIKTTTLGVVLLSVVALWKGRPDTVGFHRRISADTVRRAHAIGLIATVIVITDTLLLTTTERADFLAVLFEVVSALGTVGLSTGLTPDLSPFGRILISITMLLGRVGPLAVGFALVAGNRSVRYREAEEKVFVG